jgi:hypothetical protein
MYPLLDKCGGLENTQQCMMWKEVMRKEKKYEEVMFQKQLQIQNSTPSERFFAQERRTALGSVNPRSSTRRSGSNSNNNSSGAASTSSKFSASFRTLPTKLYNVSNRNLSQMIDAQDRETRMLQRQLHDLKVAQRNAPRSSAIRPNNMTLQSHMRPLQIARASLRHAPAASRAKRTANNDWQSWGKMASYVPASSSPSSLSATLPVHQHTPLPPPTQRQVLEYSRPKFQRTALRPARLPRAGLVKNFNSAALAGGRRMSHITRWSEQLLLSKTFLY